jgi:hypothetical protein
LSSGALLTLQACEELLKPVCLIDGDENRPVHAAKQLREFIAAQDIQRLNVAGPRASHWPGAQQYAQDVIRLLLSMT